MKVRIESADGAAVGPRILQNLRVSCLAETALGNVQHIPSLLAQQLGRGAWQPLVEHKSGHAASSGKI